MSVTYYINKKLRVRGLQEKGYEITDNRENEEEYPIIIKHKDAGDSWLGIDEIVADDINDTEFYRLEGKMFTGGIAVMFKLAEDFGIKFMDDDFFDTLYFREEHNFKEEDEMKLFNERCDSYMNKRR
jgi:hypothetical protein